MEDWNPPKASYKHIATSQRPILLLPWLDHLLRDYNLVGSWERILYGLTSKVSLWTLIPALTTIGTNWLGWKHIMILGRFDQKWTWLQGMYMENMELQNTCSTDCWYEASEQWLIGWISFYGANRLICYGKGGILRKNMGEMQNLLWMPSNLRCAISYRAFIPIKIGCILVCNNSCCQIQKPMMIKKFKSLRTGGYDSRHWLLWKGASRNWNPRLCKESDRSIQSNFCPIHHSTGPY